MNTAVLLACLSPIVIIFIVMKLAVWMSGIYTEEKYVESPENPTDRIWQMRMQTLTKRKKSMEIAQIIDDALYDYYVVQRGEDVPNWRYIKDQDWWLEYLDSLGIPRRNP